MKKLVFGLLGLSLMSFTAAGVASNVFTIKQTVTFSDGSNVEVYYNRDNGTYSCFSEADLSKYSKKDIDSIVDSDFEMCLEPKGALVYQTSSMKESIKLARKFIK